MAWAVVVEVVCTCPCYDSDYGSCCFVVDVLIVFVVAEVLIAVVVADAVYVVLHVLKVISAVVTLYLL